MSRYNENQLSAMANIALNAKRDGDMRYLELVIKMSMATGLPTEEVERRIEEMAR